MSSVIITLFMIVKIFELSSFEKHFILTISVNKSAP
ncbi:hypothetical protein SAN_2158 [Streptococcus agalactiae COH1]|nr:hypothetical protein SAN_2175 [Streptococcus agalactiae COH1]EAO76517.1 hypothetical protein SAN_2158 [Streptococcus agalactiae COH1]